MKDKVQHIFEKGIAMDDLHFWMEECAHNDEAFLTFWQFALDDTQEKSWRALWVVEHAIKKNKAQSHHIFPEIYTLLLNTNNHSILRMGLKLVLLHPIPNNDETGHLLTKCESLVLDSKIPVATRANSLQFMYEFCKIEPELSTELMLLLDHIGQETSSGGMTARIRNIRKGLNKLSKS